ncbi:hypothetical protein [Haloarchaeobius sp. DFWS5]|uniref:hypothetical protein n=1 Tax=Haloarchaeobius sp. DFWS5 TaxID=3446114 RepID=UPI003EBD67BC
MKSDRLSRREILHLSSIGLAGLAGCAGQGPNDSGGKTPTATAGEPTYSDVVDSPASVTVRNSEGKSAVRSTEHSPEENLSESEPQWDYEDWLVTSTAEGEALEFQSTTTGGDEAATFVADTDFASETVVVHQYNISPCETRRPNRLKWGENFSCGGATCAGIYLGYEEEDVDDECEDDESFGGPPSSDDPHDSEAALVRIPDQLRSYGRFSSQW